jgi:hypothetical protein
MASLCHRCSHPSDSSSLHHYLNFVGTGEGESESERCQIYLSYQQASTEARSRRLQSHWRPCSGTPPRRAANSRAFAPANRSPLPTSTCLLPVVIRFEKVARPHFCKARDGLFGWAANLQRGLLRILLSMFGCLSSASSLAYLIQKVPQ